MPDKKEIGCGLEVGDKLAFRINHGQDWSLDTIRKITPSGRMVTDHYTVNPDMSIRGRRTFGPHRAELVTADILAAIKHQQNLLIVRRIDTEFYKRSPEDIQAIVDIFRGTS